MVEMFARMSAQLPLVACWTYRYPWEEMIWNATTIARLILCAAVLSSPAGAEIVLERLSKQVESQAHALFRDMPKVVVVKDTREHCGADRSVSAIGAYCTTENLIYLTDTFPEPDFWAHHLAHLYGHAVQVRHGVADVALRQIRSRPQDEELLRGWVTRQVECIAGVILAQTDLGSDSLTNLYTDEPLTDSHWGRDPLAIGPKVSIGLDARAEWFEIGRTEGLSSCAPGEVSSELLLKAQR